MQLASISSVKGNTPFELDEQSRRYSWGREDLGTRRSLPGMLSLVSLHR